MRCRWPAAACPPASSARALSGNDARYQLRACTRSARMRGGESLRHSSEHRTRGCKRQGARRSEKERESGLRGPDA
eukprot:1316506-Rhodomonas_salina.1